jgi:hypothetical protein
MIELAWQIGPRVHEIAGLTMKDITLAEGTVPTYFIRIIGKGNKQRPVTPKLVGNAACYFKDWLDVRGEAPGALFWFISYRGNLRRLDQNLTSKTLHSILKDRVARAGLQTTTWHNFRRIILSDVIACSRPYPRPAPGRPWFIRHHGALRLTVEIEHSGSHKLPTRSPLPHWGKPSEKPSQMRSYYMEVDGEFQLISRKYRRISQNGQSQCNGKKTQSGGSIASR